MGLLHILSTEPFILTHFSWVNNLLQNMKRSNRFSLGTKMFFLALFAHWPQLTGTSKEKKKLQRLSASKMFWSQSPAKSNANQQCKAMPWNTHTQCGIRIWFNTPSGSGWACLPCGSRGIRCRPLDLSLANRKAAPPPSLVVWWSSLWNCAQRHTPAECCYEFHWAYRPEREQEEVGGNVYCRSDVLFLDYNRGI